jgi:glycerol-3-phosphate dehydrogenase
MDISILDVVAISNEGYRCVIRNPKTDKDTNLVIVIKGVYAEGFQEASDAADDIPKTCAVLAKYTIGWENLEVDGKSIEFSAKEAERIYSAYPLIRGQVFKAALDVKNFIRG